MTQLITTLGRDNSFVRLVVRRNITGLRWEFPKGMKVAGIRYHDGTWRIWPHGQDHAFILGVSGAWLAQKWRK